MSDPPFDPFSRGPHPVGVSSFRVGELHTELWYPAAASLVGADLEPQRQDRYDIVPGMYRGTQAALRDAEPAPCHAPRPLALFSHGYGGHRRQASYLTTHLASHGYVVAAVDHLGTCLADMGQGMLASREVKKQRFREALAARPRHLATLVDAVAARASVRTTAIGLVGHSLGGWTALAAAGQDPRVAAVVALAPAGGETPAGGEKLRRGVDFEAMGGREVQVSFFVAERDSVLPLAGIRTLYRHLQTPSRRFFLLDNADHLHFADDAKRLHEMFRNVPLMTKIVPVASPFPPFDELCPAEHGHDLARAGALSQLDAVIRGSVTAASALASLHVHMATRGASVRLE